MSRNSAPTCRACAQHHGEERRVLAGYVQRGSVVRQGGLAAQRLARHRSRSPYRHAARSLGRLTLTLPAATAGNSDAYRDVAGLVQFTPATSASPTRGHQSCSVPYFLVPRVLGERRCQAGAAEEVEPPASLQSPTRTARSRATADFYAWGLEDPKEQDSAASTCTPPVCSRSQTLGVVSQAQVVFAVNTYKALVDADIRTSSTSRWILNGDRPAGELHRVQRGSRLPPDRWDVQRHGNRRRYFDLATEAPSSADFTTVRRPPIRAPCCSR